MEQSEQTPTETLEIRAHHLDSFARTINLSREELAQRLIQGKYIENPEDPFVDHIVRINRLITNPKQRLNILVGKPDAICRACPRMTRKNNCPLVDHTKSMYFGTVFDDPAQILEGMDRESLANYPTLANYQEEPDRTYTSEELFPKSV